MSAPDPPPVPPEEDTFPQEELDRTKRRRWILQFAKRGGVGAEIGVFRGHFAAEIADYLKPAKLYLVDPWTKLGERFDLDVYPEYTNFNRLTTAQAMRDAQRRVAPFGDQTDIEFVEDFLEGFCARISAPLDFVYLDTYHGYESTLAELEAVSAIVHDYGMIMGDDWTPDLSHPHAGVLRAVNDFIRERDYELVAAGPDSQWCIRRTPPYSTPRRPLSAPDADPTPSPDPPRARPVVARARQLAGRVTRRARRAVRRA